MIIYADDYNPIIEYNDKIQSGEIIACLKIKQVYKHIVKNINNPDFEFEYDSSQANKAIEFIENFCKHSKGEWGGKPIVLELWQKAFIAAVFGMVHKVERTRQYREVFKVVARKNGKSVEASGIGLKCLLADNELGAEIYSVATKRDQAKIVWDEAVRIVEMQKAFSKRLKCLTGSINYKKKDSFFKPLSSESKTQDGLNVHCAIFDEMHAFTDSNLYNVVVDGTSSRRQPLILTITTAGTVRENIYDEKYAQSEAVINGYSDPNGYKNESFLPVIYELDNRDEYINESAWIKANPNLGVSKKYDYIRAKIADAIEFPNRVKNLVCKDFNIRETSEQSWLTFDELFNPAKFSYEELKPKYGIGGADLSRTNDLTSAVMLFEVPNSDFVFVDSMYWIPEELFRERIKSDKVPYDKWYDEKLIRLCAGNKINPRDITQWYLELKNQKGIYLNKLGYDRYSAQMWVGDMEDNFGKITLPVAQGKMTLSNPMLLMGCDLRSKVINYNDNPIMKWCLSNMAVDIDINGNVQPCKANNQQQRIDGGAAMLNAYVVYTDEKKNYRNLIGKK